MGGISIHLDLDGGQRLHVADPMPQTYNVRPPSYKLVYKPQEL